MTLKLLELARDTSLLKSMRLNKMKVKEASYFNLINDVVSCDVAPVEKPKKRVLTLANTISNLEPSIYLSDGSNLSLAQIRLREELEESEIEFVQKKMFEVMQGFITGSQTAFNGAIRHLLLGEAVTKDISVTKDILLSTLIHTDINYNLAKLIGYAIAFKCKSVSELGDLFAFHYVDVYDEACKTGYIRYRFCGQQYESMVKR